MTSPKLSPQQVAIQMRLNCPECGELHIDVGDFATKVHHTHACQSCGAVWRPAVVATVGVQFLPGFKNEHRAAELERPAPGGEKRARELFDCGECIVAIDGCYDQCVRTKDRPVGDGGGEGQRPIGSPDKVQHLPSEQMNSSGESEPSPQPSANKAVREWRDGLLQVSGGENLTLADLCEWMHKRGDALCLEIERLEKLVAGSGETRVVPVETLRQFRRKFKTYAGIFDGDKEARNFVDHIFSIISGERAGS